MSEVGFDEALRTILSTVLPLPEEDVALAHALGRVTATTVVADEDAVPFPRSAMDGYAVRASEYALAMQDRPIEVPVAGQVFAERGESTLAPGTALAIATGAPIPRGADAVIPQERTERHGTAVSIFAPITPGDCVFPPGEDFRRGDELVKPGEVLNSGKLSLLAFAGKPTVRVFWRPRVSIVCTGNELVDVAATPTHGQVRNSNAVALSALVLANGGEPRYEGVAPDDGAALAAILQRGARDADLLITTGGVPVCILPGNPAAAFVCFQKLVRPALARLSGRCATGLPELRARLDTELHGRPGRRYFVLAHLHRERDSFVVQPLANQCSALVRTTADANAIVTVREAASGSKTGLHRDEMVDVEVFDWPSVFESSRN